MHFNIFDKLGMNDKDHYGSLEDLNIDLEEYGILRAVNEFANLPWWSRVWTYQEYMLARELVFQSGFCRLDILSLRKFLREFTSHSQCWRHLGIQKSIPGTKRTITPDLSSLLALETGRERWAAQSYLMDKLRDQHIENLFYVLAMTRTRQCKDPLDKVYGILGLFDRSARAQLCPDYSLSPRVVFTDAPVAAIFTSETLYPLSHVYGEKRCELELPSYVPDFTANVDVADQPLLLVRCQVTNYSFRASEASSTVISVHPSLEASTKAIFVDTIDDVVQIIDIIFDESRMRTFWKVLCGGLVHDVAEVATTCGKRPLRNSDYPHFRAWWETELARVIRRCVDESDQKAFVAAYESVSIRRSFSATETSADVSYRNIIKNLLNGAGSDVLDFAWEEGPLRLDQSVAEAIVGRQVALTSIGYRCLVPERAKKGDNVVLMPGGSVPYILRPAPLRPERGGEVVGRYIFLGDSYIHGIMYGEAWDESKLRDIILV